MNKEEIKYLAGRVASGLATEEELALYNKLYNAAEMAFRQSDEKIEVDKEAVKLEIRQAIATGTARNRGAFRIARLRWAAAAVFILLAGPAVYFLLHQPKTSPAPIANKIPGKVNQIIPGGNKAVLTLSNGTAITLDSVANDTLAQEAGVKIVKLSGGVVSYDAHNKKDHEIAYNTISTPAGGQYHLILEDGSDVWLNAASALRFPASFQGPERAVELTGEAYFEVKHNASKPFRVKVNNLTVEVLGTHFNINSYRDEASVKTTLLEGSVRVHDNNQTMLLQPREQAIFNYNDQSVQKLKNADIEEVIAWKEGRFRFHQMPIEAVMRQVARWYNVEVEYQGRIPKEVFSGDVSRQEDVNQLLDILRATNILSFQLEGKKIIVTSLNKNSMNK